MLGVPSTNNKTPFQIAEALDLPILMAYEFMFKPQEHPVWSYLPRLQEKPLLRWAVPLPKAREDFEAHALVDVIGDMSIDNAYAPKSETPATKIALEIAAHESLTFLSSTTQPITTDTAFLDQVLEELPNHPLIQVRLGLHPGIQDLDTYLAQIIEAQQ